MPLRKLSGAEMQRLSPDEFHRAPKHPIYVMLQNIRSMWNVGSIFRTCDAARIEQIIITGYTATPPRKEIEKQHSALPKPLNGHISSMHSMP